ncbi:cory-CC-star protein [Neisseria weaveri]|uniref:DNA helicase n=1 Tax=Neisseria weaveri TaxID=28091 RepID=A0A3S4Z9A8_9NEIS|nr:cory-CC-star protein [Neisseria weaveri]EGV36631.1 hypothetical protein l13_07250 [Neisseria weaveri ATCC 51223]EGV36667.1 hypothetical protein l11_16150 [Neisseria weaveri LMG 5135]SAY51817.1 Uncharacterised protein [Neisseria weaveri]VEJ51239.1 Uncharacterised protein [Neisseria weaveri]
MEWRKRLKAIAAGLHEFYHAPYRRTLTAAYRDEADLFMLLVFAESLGVPNPMTFYTLELQPLLMEEFHDWHKRMGMTHSPLERFGCC